MIPNLFRDAPGNSTAKRFRAVILEMLGLPEDADENELRGALITRGSDILEWYENRISAVEDSAGHLKCRGAPYRRAALRRPGRPPRP